MASSESIKAEPAAAESQDVLEIVDRDTGEMFALVVPDPRVDNVPVGYAEDWVLPAVARVTHPDVLDEAEALYRAHIGYAEALKKDSLEFEKALRIIEARRGEMLGVRPHEGVDVSPGQPEKNYHRGDNSLPWPDEHDQTKSRWRTMARYWRLVIWPFVQKAKDAKHVSQAAMLRIAKAAEKYLTDVDPDVAASIASHAVAEADKPEAVIDAIRRHSRAEAAAADTVLRDGGDFGVIHGKFVDVSERLADESVPLIFTDPPYHDKTLHLYRDLGLVASRVLEDGGSLITYTSHHKMPEVIDMLKDAGLTFFWPLAMVHTGQKARMTEYGIVVHWKPLLWFVKGKFRSRDSMTFVDDLVMSERQKGTHAWQQSTTEATYYIEKLSVRGDLVFDPFCGGGTTAVAAKHTGRRWLTCDVDSTSVTLARQRIMETADVS